MRTVVYFSFLLGPAHDIAATEDVPIFLWVIRVLVVVTDAFLGSKVGNGIRVLRVIAIQWPVNALDVEVRSVKVLLKCVYIIQKVAMITP